MYEYAATVIGVVDGDSVRLDVDLGFSIRQRMALRLWGIDAPEIVGETRAAGEAARDFLRGLLPVGAKVRITTFKDKGDKYGRLLANVWLSAVPAPDDASVNRRMLDAGHAVAYSGGAR
jgi:micrococcal nuclease